MSVFKQYLPYYKRNIKVAMPIVMSQIGGAIVQLADTLMVGQLGTVELAAASFANAVFVIGFVFSLSILVGITPLVGHAYMRDERQNVTELFQNGLLLSGILAVVMFVLLYVVSFFMGYMGQESGVVALAVPYYRILVCSIVPFLLFSAVRQFLEGLANTKFSMFITIFSNLLNILLNYLFIFGKWGFPEWGMFGAGFATFVSRLIMPFLFFIVIRRKPEWWSYCVSFRKEYFSVKRLKQLMSLGLPIASHQLMEVSAFAISGVMIGWIGSTQLASHYIANNVAHFAFMVVLGVASATTIRVSHQYGLRDFESLKMAARASMHICIVANLTMALLMVVFRHTIVGFFTTDPVVADLAALLLIFVALFQFSDGLQVVGTGILRGIADVRPIAKYAFIAYVMINIPLGYILAFKVGLGPVGIWLAFSFGLSVAAFLFLRRYKSRLPYIKAELESHFKLPAEGEEETLVA